MRTPTITLPGVEASTTLELTLPQRPDRYRIISVSTLLETTGANSEMLLRVNDGDGGVIATFGVPNISGGGASYVTFGAGLGGSTSGGAFRVTSLPTSLWVDPAHRVTLEVSNFDPGDKFGPVVTMIETDEIALPRRPLA